MFSFSFLPDVALLYSGHSIRDILKFHKKALHIEQIRENIYMDIDEKRNLVSITVEHTKESAGLWEFSYEEVRKKTA